MAKGTTIRMWRRSMIVLVGMVVLGFGLISVRLVKLQLIQGEALQKMATDQQLADTKINAQRGTIYDCSMKPLAQSATVWTVVLEPAYLDTDTKRELVSDGLSKILELDKNALLEKSKKKSYYTVIKRKVESDIKDKIIEFKTQNKVSNGIRLIEDYKRYYPYGSFAAAVLGFTGTDSQGLAGLEAYYDSYLTGEAGRVITAKNAIGTDMPFDYEQMVPAKNGYSLVLAIDEVIQHFVEKNLEEGIVNNKVQNRATAIVMDVNTGEILGMAVKGDFDPNKPFEIVDSEEAANIEKLSGEEKTKAQAIAWEKQWRNKAVSDTYYPGSVFKMVTASMGLEENVVNENTPFSCSGGIKPYPNARYISCHKKSGHGAETFLQGLCNSCNPVFVILGQNLGAERFYKYYSAFGFSEKTGIDLPGEASDIFFSNDGSMAPMDLAVASFGQNFSITPIQMVTAAAAVANGGNLVTPHIVKHIVDDNGNIIRTMDCQVKRKVISADTSKRMCAMLQTNATTGTGKNGYVAGYRVGGKTGTSEKIGSSGPNGMDYIASYCGFAPADDPKIAMLVFFDTPKGGSYYGSAVAAPVFAKTMADVLPYLGIERKYTDEELAKIDSVAPSLVGKTVGQAKNEAEKASLIPIVVGSGNNVVSQMPIADKKIPKGGTIVIYTDGADKGMVKVPRLTGLSPSEANRVAANSQLGITLSGITNSGSDVVSVSQSVGEGTEVKPGTNIEVNFIQKGQSD